MQAHCLDEAHTSIKVILDSGKEWSVPATPGNRHYDELIESGTPIEDYVKPPEQVRAEAIEQIEADFQAEIAPVTEGYTQAEIDSWPFQLDEAERYILALESGATVNTPRLDAMVAENGRDKEDLARSIISNSEQWTAVYFPALGRKQRRLAELG